MQPIRAAVLRAQPIVREPPRSLFQRKKWGGNDFYDPPPGRPGILWLQEVSLWYDCAIRREYVEHAKDGGRYPVQR